MPARFHEQDVLSGLKQKRKLSAFLDTLVIRYMPQVSRASFTYIFCNDAYLLQMNKQYLQHDTLTDIITFDLTEQERSAVGEIYISTERVTENAAKYKVPYIDELHRVIFHGALHLCGFKDKKEADKKIMRQKEDECIAAYNKELIK